MERTLAIIKPGFIHLYNELCNLIKDEGYNILYSREHFKFSLKEIEKLYEEHKDKYFFNDLVEYMMSSECIILILEKENCINDFRQFLEKSIRPKYSIDYRHNVMHGSDSFLSFQKESSIFKLI